MIIMSSRGDEVLMPEKKNPSSVSKVQNYSEGKLKISLLALLSFY